MSTHRTRVPGKVGHNQTGTNNPANLGWRRFYLSDATWTEDSQSQHGSVVEDADKTTWTSAASITISTGDQNHIPNQGALYGIELKDANGESLSWDRPWQCHFLIETVESNRDDLLNTKIYYGFGLTAYTSALDDTNPCLGEAVAWDLSSNSREVIFRRNNQSTATTDKAFDFYSFYQRGPRYLNQSGHWKILNYKYNPADNTDGLTTATTYGQSPVTTATTGPVYAFVSCGVRATISSAVSADFRIWYSVTGAADWNPA